MREWVRPLNLLEAAYRLDGTTDEWLRDLVRALGAVLPREDLMLTGACVLGTIDVAGRSIISRFENVHAEGRAVRQPAAFWRAAMDGAIPAEMHQRLYFSAPLAGTASEVTGLGPRLAEVELWADNPAWDGSAAKDALGISFHEGGMRAGALALGLRETSILNARERALGERLAIHIGAAFRLRLSRMAAPEHADAVFTPAGRIQDLRCAADAEAVSAGFARRRHARRPEVPPEAALEVWSGLHDGRWSLVDYLDTDGKAFVLAVRNEPARDVASTLTDRQRAAVALAALGYGNKQIAYALGLTATAVAMLLARARVATGIRTRAELVRAFKQSLAEPRS